MASTTVSLSAPSKSAETDVEETPIILTFQATPKKLSGINDIEFNWYLDQQLRIDDFLKITHYSFQYGGWIEERKNASGYAICTTPEFKNKGQIIYLLTFRGFILKGGRSKNSLRKRSYPAGTVKTWINGGGSGCSDTNYIFSQIWRQCIKDGTIGDFKFYIYQAPLSTVKYMASTGETSSIEISPYEAMETNLNEHLRTILGRNPVGDGDLLNPNKR